MSDGVIEQGTDPTPTLPRLRGRELIRKATSRILPRKRRREARGWGLGVRGIGR
jgi:hypothetical protein